MATARLQKIVEEAFTPLATAQTLAEMREKYDLMAPPIQDDITVEKTTIGGVPGLYLRPAAVEAPENILLYFHGGGYQLGSAQSHAEMVSHIVRGAQCAAFLADYRLAPEHPYPAAVDDAVAAYRGILEQWDANRIAVGGDSAGGGLAIGSLFAGRQEGLPIPGCVTAISAFADLTMTSPTLTDNVNKDPIVTPELYGMSAVYLDGHSPEDPFASPVFGDFTGLPPMLLQVGTDETLLWDTFLIADRARKAGVRVDLEVGLDLVHVYQLFTWCLPEALEALNRVSQFINQHTGANSA